MAGSTLYIVRCMAYTYRDSICSRRYACGKKSFHNQTNACPDCGSNKAQWVQPGRTLKKDET